MVVEVISGRLALQHCTSIYEQHVARIVLQHLCHKSMNTLETSFSPVFMTEVIRKVIPMYVCRENNLQMFSLCAHTICKVTKKYLLYINNCVILSVLASFLLCYLSEKLLKLWHL